MPESEIERELRRSVGSEISEKDLKNTIILNAKALIEKDADFAKFAGRILLSYIYEEVLDWSISKDGIDKLKHAHKTAFKSYLKHGVAIKRLHPSCSKTTTSTNSPTPSIPPPTSISTTSASRPSTTATSSSTKPAQAPPHRNAPVLLDARRHGPLQAEEKDRESWAIRLYNLYKGRRFCSSTPPSSTPAPSTASSPPATSTRSTTPSSPS
jgi:ribonucleoside-diphosphate reductase alpha chain